MKGLPTGWRLWALWGAVWLFLFPDTLWAMVRIWWRSDTYAHGFVVYPIAAWLAWRLRDRLRGLPLRPSPWGLAALLGLGVTWLLGRVGDLLALEMLAWALMLPAGVWALGGWAWLRTLAFPLAFTLFAVPIGEPLVPPLQDLTAWMAVNLLRLTGIPVFWEGRFFHIPSGSFEVAEACSGVRYLYASLTFGALYAYLNLRGRRAWAFFALSAVVPILANGIRAYGIVMIAHLSDYKLAVGVDHYLYGWLFFGVVIAFLLYVGERLRRGQAGGRTVEAATAATTLDAPPARIAAAFLLALATLAAPRAWAALAGGDEALAPTPRLLSVPGWTGPGATKFGWQPFYHHPDLTLAGRYERSGVAVEVHVVHYRDQTQDKELFNSRNRLWDEDPWQKTWMRLGESRQSTDVAVPAHVRETRVRYGERQLVLWSWYVSEAGVRLQPLRLKWDEIRAQLLGRPAWASLVVLAAPFDVAPEEGRGVLSSFLGETGVPVRWEGGS